ncbi:MAG: ATP synthase F0 subunit B [Deltaproteobacteria bacterium]|nr:ATP synthase F0 subunit B [Deltaproteobacteria bacterium]
MDYLLLTPILSAAPDNDTVKLFFASSVIIFLVIWRILAKHFFKPVFEVLEQREARTVGDEHEAKLLTDQDKRAQIELASELKIIRAQAIKKREAIVSEAKQQAAKVLETAHAQAAEELKGARAQITVLREQAKQDLSSEIEKLAAVTYDRLLSANNTKTLH